jgi:hypothetical protein
MKQIISDPLLVSRSTVELRILQRIYSGLPEAASYGNANRAETVNFAGFMPERMRAESPLVEIWRVTSNDYMGKTRQR